MKFFKYLILFSILISALHSCKKESGNKWEIKLENEFPNVQLTDISKTFYDSSIPLDQFKEKYPWFQGSVSDADYSARRADIEEIKIYKEAIAKINQPKLKEDLTLLFAHIENYFPDFKTPQVFLFSSDLQMAQDPVFLEPKNNLLFIDITGFMGENNPYYKGMEHYFQVSMNPQNIIPKVSATIANQLIRPDKNHQKFLDKIIFEGKLLTLQDAFLPTEPDYLKMNYSQKQYEWAEANEENIWNFFVENNLVFSDDPRLEERFLSVGPFSKFYTAIDNESSPQIGIFSGWQICRKYFKQKRDTKLQDFLKMDAQTIFNDAQYRPKTPN
ncbi:gliding motility protein GldB [Halpernia sp.]|uniref:gliding motility lipoprotein GldB n=1 Tax=Halpernia sp. TaxID=2782209 RepID=UPI003A8F76B4